MLNEEDIAQQQEKLAAIRRRLKVLLVQIAKQGSMHAPSPKIVEVDEARAEIAHLKKLLRTNGTSVEDHPDDMPNLPSHASLMRHRYVVYWGLLLLPLLVISLYVLGKPDQSPILPQPTSMSTSMPTIAVSTETVIGGNELPCVKQAEKENKSHWETCWYYVHINSLGQVVEASKENATAISWKGPQNLSKDIGQHHKGYVSEWYAWADQGKEVRFCIDVQARTTIDGQDEEVKPGCYAWKRGPFRIH